VPAEARVPPMGEHSREREREREREKKRESVSPGTNAFTSAGLVEQDRKESAVREGDVAPSINCADRVVPTCGVVLFKSASHGSRSHPVLLNYLIAPHVTALAAAASRSLCAARAGLTVCRSTVRNRDE